jgi:putative peptidoglycan lipid II flippase
MVISMILLVTKIIGFLKLRMISGYFGASRELDLFWAASLVPDTIFNILIAGSINAAVIPIFAEVKHIKGERKLVKLFAMTAFFISLILLLITSIAFVYAQGSAELLVNGFQIDMHWQIKDWVILNINHFVEPMLKGLTAVDLTMLVKLSRILLLSPLLLSMSALISSFLQVHKQFFITTVAPFVYNLSFVLIIVVYAKITGNTPTAYTLAWTIVLASLMHLLTQLPLLFNFVNKSLKIDSLSDINGKTLYYYKEVKRMLLLAVPRVLGILGEYINLVINTIRGLGLAEGALSANKYAISLYALPGQIFASAIAQVTLPNLSEHFAKGDKKSFINAFNKALRWTMFIMLPAATILLVLRLPIVRIVYGTGEFDWWDTIVTSWALALLSGAVIGQSVVALVMRAFFAMKETWLPLIATVISVIVNVVATYYFINFFSHYLDWRPIFEQIGSQLSIGMGEAGVTGLFETIGSFISDLGVWLTTRNEYDFAVGGLSLGLTVTFLVEMVIGMIFLQRRMKIFSWKETWSPIIEMFFASIAAGVAMYGAYRFFELLLDTSYVFNLIITFVGAVSVGGVVYLIYAWFMDIPEMLDIWKFIQKVPFLNRIKFKRRKSKRR